MRPHPAVQAWLRANPRSRPRALETIKETSSSQIYRLVGARPRDGSVVAKRGPAAKLKVEQAVYTNVLPSVPVPKLECYGWVEPDEGQMGWIFLEDVAGQPFDRHISPHRIAAAKWLATVHLATAAMTPQLDLPIVDLERHRREVRRTREAVVQTLSSVDSTSEVSLALRQALATLDAIELKWEAMERRSQGRRPTLVHGDLVPKNVRVRPERVGSTLVALDWGSAGWGLGAADMGLVDLPSYASIVARQWPEVTLERARETACIGKVFRWIATVRSASAKLCQPAHDGGAHHLKECERGLSTAFAELQALP